MALTDAEPSAGLSDIPRIPIRSGQNIGLAVAAGIAAAIVSAMLWAVITVVTQMELGVVAIAIGYLVGQAVRAAGNGGAIGFGLVGAACALFGCVLGNVLSAVTFYAWSKGIHPGDLLTQLSFALVQRLSVAFFQPMDLFFYAVAVYEGYRFSRKREVLKTSVE
jgi:hypothetical protein